MATLANILGKTAVNQLYRGVNSDLNISQMPEPKKEDKLYEDLKWVDMHVDYLANVKRTLSFGLEDILNSPGQAALLVNTPILLHMFVNDRMPDYDTTVMGYHVNATLVRMPCIIMTEARLESQASLLHHILSTPEIHLDTNDIRLRRLVMREGFSKMRGAFHGDHEKILVGTDFENHKLVTDFPYFKLLCFNESYPTIGDKTAIPDTYYSLAADARITKRGVFNIKPKLVGRIRDHGTNFVGMPLFPEHFFEWCTPMKHNEREYPTKWEFLK